jgi:hypothetical protein
MGNHEMKMTNGTKCWRSILTVVATALVVLKPTPISPGTIGAEKGAFRREGTVPLMRAVNDGQLAHPVIAAYKSTGDGTFSEDPLVPPAALAANGLVPEVHPLAEKINRFLQGQKYVTNFQQTGLKREDYLKLIDAQITTLRRYQDAEGRIIDPVRHGEWYYSTPCYAHAVAALVVSGYNTDPTLLESGMKAMDAATADMAGGMAPKGLRDMNTGDFYPYPVMMAFNLYAQVAPAERLAQWRQALAAVIPTKLYRVTDGNGNNWGVVNLAGEYLRANHGLGEMEYVERNLSSYLQRFTEVGMFHEEGAPLPYDHFSRYFLAGILHQGYRGRNFERCRELVWRGAWTSLFLMSSFGEFPTGYRSSHHLWNEAESVATYEIYAAHYARSGRLAEAGAFKRAAHLSVQCIKQWVRPDGTFYIVKNRYPPEAQHGYEVYSVHTCYNLLTCSMLATAWQFADEAVRELPAPADFNTYVLPLLQPSDKSFHKVFAAAGGSLAEYDTNGDHVYNPTGLLRIHLKGGHPQLGPSDGCAPKFSGPGVNLAVGPSWRDKSGVWHSLAEMSPPEAAVEVLEEGIDTAAFRVTYKDLKVKEETGPGVRLAETVTVKPDRVTIQDEILDGPVTALRINYPMLIFDGQKKTRVRMMGNTLGMELEGKRMRLTLSQPSGVILKRTGKELGHRNGIVEPVFGEIQGLKAVYIISVN